MSKGTRTTVIVRQSGGMPSPITRLVHLQSLGAVLKLSHNLRMIGDSTAIATWPASVWYSGATTFRATIYFGDSRIQSAMLAPYGRYPDVDASDNVWPRDPRRHGAP